MAWRVERLGTEILNMGRFKKELFHVDAGQKGKIPNEPIFVILYIYSKDFTKDAKF